MQAQPQHAPAPSPGNDTPEATAGSAHNPPTRYPLTSLLPSADRPRSPSLWARLYAVLIRLRRLFVTRLLGLLFVLRAFCDILFYTLSFIAHIILLVLSLLYRYVLLLAFPSRYAPRVQALAHRVATADALADVPAPWQEENDAVTQVRDDWRALHKSLSREWVLSAGTCGGICALGGTILQTSTLTEMPVINMIGVIAVVAGFDGLLMSLNQIRHLGNIQSLQSAWHFAAVVVHSQNATFFTVGALLAGPAARLFWSILLMLLFFLCTYGWRTVQSTSPTSVVYPVLDNTLISGLTGASGGGTTPIFATWCSIIVGIFVVLSVAQFLAVSWYFSFLGLPPPSGDIALGPVGGGASAANDDDDDIPAAPLLDSDAGQIAFGTDFAPPGNNTTQLSLAGDAFDELDLGDL